MKYNYNIMFKKENSIKIALIPDRAKFTNYLLHIMYSTKVIAIRSRDSSNALI